MAFLRYLDVINVTTTLDSVASACTRIWGSYLYLHLNVYYWPDGYGTHGVTRLSMAGARSSYLKVMSVAREAL